MHPKVFELKNHYNQDKSCRCCHCNNPPKEQKSSYLNFLHIRFQVFRKDLDNDNYLDFQFHWNNYRHRLNNAVLFRHRIEVEGH